MARYSFARLGEWADKTEDRMRRVVRQSIQEVIDIAQRPVAQGGQMPVDTSFLRNSLASDRNGAGLAAGPDSHIFAIAGFNLGDVARFGWTAAYARPRHYMVGVGQGGGMWRDTAAAQWQAIVARNARRVR